MVCFHLILNFKFASSRVLAPADRCAEVAQGDFPGQTDRGGAPWSYRYYCYSSWRSLGAEATRSVLPSLRRLQEWPVKQLLLQPSVLSPTLHPPSSSSPSPPPAVIIDFKPATDSWEDFSSQLWKRLPPPRSLFQLRLFSGRLWFGCSCSKCSE